MMNRRDLLAAFLGVVLTGCRRQPMLPPGTLVGADVALGHRLRERHTLKPDVWEAIPLIIVGAGVAGLSAARQQLRQKDQRFLVLELESQAGGTSRSTTGPIPHPWGAHYLPAPRRANAPLVDLLKEMGCVEGQGEDGEPIYGEHILCRDPHERLFARGQWQEGLWLTEGAGADDEAQRQRFFAEVDRWVTWRDGGGRRAFTLPSRASSDDRDVLELDRLSMGDWARQQGFTSSRLLWQIDYACRDDYGAKPDDVSAWAGLFYFASRRPTAGVETQPVLTWPEGNGRLITHLAQDVPLRTGVAVAEIIPHERGVDVIGLSAGGQLLGWHADRVIFAAPRFLAPYLIRGYPRPTGLTYGSWMVANLHLSARPREEGYPLCWDNVLYDSPSLGYVVATHQQGVDHGPTILTYYYPLCESNADAGRRLLYSLGRDEWAELALSDLERAHPHLRSLVTRIDVMRWGHAMIRPSVGSRRNRLAADFRGIHFAHSDLGGLPLFEEAFDAGLRATVTS